MPRHLVWISAAVLLLASVLDANEDIRKQVAAAIVDGNTGLLKRHLEANKKIVNVRLDSRATTPLILSIRKGKPKCARLLVAAKAELKATDAFGLAALHHALLAQQPERVSWLCEKGADVNQLDGVGRSPLAYAASWPKDADKAIEILSKHGLDRELRANQITLYEAVEKDREDIAGKLLAIGLSPDVKGEYGTPLHRASKPKTIALLLAAGASPAALDQTGGTPLSYMTDSEAARSLLKAGAAKTINLQDEHGNSAIFYSSSHALFNLLMNAGADCRRKGKFGQVPLHGICLNQNKGMVKAVLTLLAKGEDANVADDDGNTPLHYCAMVSPSDDLAVVKTLLARGARPSMKNKSGHTPLFVALDRLNGPVAEFLAKKEALTARDKAALQLKRAVASGSYKDAKLLLQEHKDVSKIVDSYGVPPVTYRIADERMVALLVDAGADANSKDASGYSALHYAALNGAADSAKFLLQQGATVNDAVPHTPYFDRPWVRAGFTALHLAVAAEAGRVNEKLPPTRRAQQLAIAELLLSKGAKMPQAADGNTPLHLVGSREMLALLLKHTHRQSIDLENSDGDTALHLAARRKHHELVVLFIKAGANVKVKNKLGKTPLDCLLERRKLNDEASPILHWILARIARGEESGRADLALLAKKVDLQQCNSLGDSALHSALRLGLGQEAEVLMEAGVPIDTRNLDHDTPLHIACRRGMTSSVDLLLRKGADPRAKNIFNSSSLDVVQSEVAKAQGSSDVDRLRKLREIEQVLRKSLD